MLGVEAEGEVFLPLKPQSGQSGLVRRQKNFAYWELITACELHIGFSRAGALLTPFPARLRRGGVSATVSRIAAFCWGLGPSGIFS